MALTKYVASPLLPRVSKLEASVFNGDYDMSGYFCIEIRSVVRGYHAYKSVWIPGEQVATQQEYENPEDRYAVSVMKSSTTVRHIPREISKLSWKFIDREGEICCTVTGPRGGLEIPCIYRFNGKKKIVDKLSSLLHELNYKVSC